VDIQPILKISALPPLEIEAPIYPLDALLDSTLCSWPEGASPKHATGQPSCQSSRRHLAKVSVSQQPTDARLGTQD